MSGQIDYGGPGMACKEETKIENDCQGKQLLHRDRLFDCDALASQLSSAVALQLCLPLALSFTRCLSLHVPAEVDLTSPFSLTTTHL